jgi:hypothetical protein
MSRRVFSVTERGPLLESAARIVRDVVQAYRQRGQKVEHAFTDAALDLGATPRRVRALYYRDGVWAVARAEHDRLMRQWGHHLDRRMETLEREAEAIRAQRAQLPLNLGDNGAEWHGGGTASQPGLPGADASL